MIIVASRSCGNALKIDATDTHKLFRGFLNISAKFRFSIFRMNVTNRAGNRNYDKWKDLENDLTETGKEAIMFYAQPNITGHHSFP